LCFTRFLRHCGVLWVTETEVFVRLSEEEKTTQDTFKGLPKGSITTRFPCKTDQAVHFRVFSVEDTLSDLTVEICRCLVQRRLCGTRRFVKVATPLEIWYAPTPCSRYALLQACPPFQGQFRRAEMVPIMVLVSGGSHLKAPLEILDNLLLLALGAT
jgi:hypothetical protein